MRGRSADFILIDDPVVSHQTDAQLEEGLRWWEWIRERRVDTKACEEVGRKMAEDLEKRILEAFNAE